MSGLTRLYSHICSVYGVYIRMPAELLEKLGNDAAHPISLGSMGAPGESDEEMERDKNYLGHETRRERRIY